VRFASVDFYRSRLVLCLPHKPTTVVIYDTVVENASAIDASGNGSIEREPRRPAVAARIIFTGVAIVLAAVAFLGGGPGSGGPLDPFGILFLFASGLIWLGWDAIRDSYGYFREPGKMGKDCADLPIIRLGPMIIKGITAKQRRPTEPKH
jgi:hypothetical protein